MGVRLGTLLLLSVAGLALVQACSPVRPSAAKPKTYLPLCARALVSAQHSAPELSGAEVVPVAPSVLQPGPPVRVQCALSKGDEIGGVTFDAMCSDWQSAGCARVTAAVLNGRVVYLGEEARSAMADGKNHQRARGQR